MHILKNNRGIALLLTITIAALLVVASLELNRKVRSAVITTAGTRDQFSSNAESLRVIVIVGRVPVKQGG